MSSTSSPKNYSEQAKMIGQEFRGIISYVSKKVSSHCSLSVQEIRRIRMVRLLSAKNYHSMTLFIVFCRFYYDIDYDLFGIFVDSGIKFYGNILMKYEYVSLYGVYKMFWLYHLEDQLPKEHLKYLEDTLFNNLYNYEDLLDCIHQRKLRIAARLSFTRICKLIEIFKVLSRKKTEYQFALNHFMEFYIPDHLDNITQINNPDALRYKNVNALGYRDLENAIKNNAKCLQVLFDRIDLETMKKYIANFYWDNPEVTIEVYRSTKEIIKRGIYYPGMNDIMKDDLNFCKMYLSENMGSLSPYLQDLFMARKKMGSIRSFAGYKDVVFKFL